MKIYDANTGKELPEKIEESIEYSLISGSRYPYDLLYGDN